MWTPPVIKDLVLVGGGHAHVAVLRSFGMSSPPGVRLTLICPDVSTPYSGMLPGLISGQYTFDQAHIDLWPLARFAGARFFLDRVTGLDLKHRTVICDNRPPVPYDFLSLNIGSTPKLDPVPGAAQHVISIKPIRPFLQAWSDLKARVLGWKKPLFRLVVVGGGAGGVELLLSVQYQLHRLLHDAGNSAPSLRFHLVTASSSLLSMHPARVQDCFRRILVDRGVQVHLNFRVARVDSNSLACDSQPPLGWDAVLWATDAAAPSWVAESGLRTDSNGFASVNDRLQSLSHAEVFAAGDIASVAEHPRPKAGVFAVRQGLPLATNLRRAVEGLPLKPFRPQKQYLSLIGTGGDYAVGSRGSLAFEGKWVARWKSWIDTRWMRQYQVLPRASDSRHGMSTGAASPHSTPSPASLHWRCGGCAGKVGGATLSRVLAGLSSFHRDGIHVGLEERTDASIIEVPAGKALVQSIDYFRPLWDDPYLGGRIAANHALNDLFAMGATPHSALALVSIPFLEEKSMEAELRQILAGALRELNQAGVALLGGHSAEGSETACGLLVQGWVDIDQSRMRPAPHPGDRLILTKPLGTGVVFAAHRLGKAKGSWIHSAIQSALVSNQQASRCFLEHNTSTMTDVSGFGLAAHLLTLRHSSQTRFALQMDRIPVLPGTLEAIRQGVVSSLAPKNHWIEKEIAAFETRHSHEIFPLLFDPQTAGGLLAAVPDGEAEACLSRLRSLGYAEASCIGVVLDAGPGRGIEIDPD